MTYEEKSAIVIEQLRADRDRLLGVLDKIRAEIVQMNEDASKILMPFDGLEKISYTTGFIDGLGSALDVIDKYKLGSEV